ncbi:MAG: ECF transporter S component [Clostridiales bacterium]|jgi:uncharacterized membrane protein|nr:ECF transporter S component [Clostridiales bacterium]
MKTVEKAATSKTYFLCLTAVFTALTTVATMLLNVPAAFILGAGGNINLGDAVIFIAGFALGPWGGLVAGGIGSALADLAGYVQYAPFTLIVKGAEGFICGLIFSRASAIRPAFRMAVSIAAAGAACVAGYFFTELAVCSLYGLDDETALIILAARTLIPSLIQVSASGVIAVIAAPRFIKKGVSV